MRTPPRAWLAVLTAAAVLAVGATAAGAIRISPAGSAIYFGELTFSGPFGEVECPVEFDAFLQSGFVEEASGTPFGSFEEGVVGRCVGEGFATAVTVLPGAELQISRLLREGRAIVGKLYVIHGIKLLLAIFTGRERFSCLYAGDIGLLAPVDRTGVPGIGTVLPRASVLSLTLARLNSVFCPLEKQVTGTLAVAPDMRLED